MLTIRRQADVVPLLGPGIALLKVGRGLFALVDVECYPVLVRYHWRLHKSAGCYYAYRRHISNGRCVQVLLHNHILSPTPGMQVHHINGFTLDNRRTNLCYLTPTEHRAVHGIL